MSKTLGAKLKLRITAAVALSLLVVFSASAQTVRYVHTDGLGSVVLTTDKDRNIVERSEYEPYGGLLNRPLGDGPGFTGHVTDATTGLTYMQQRYYDPIVGRFLSTDPVTINTGTGQNFHRYWYANNNPYKFTDPDGRASWDIISDSLRVEVSAGPQLDAGIKLGKLVKVDIGFGSEKLGGGATVNDAYTFQEGHGASFGAVVADKFQFGLSPSTFRSEQGRYNIPFTESVEKGGFKIGMKQDFGKTSSEATLGKSGTEVSAKIGALLVGAEVKLDFGQLMYGIISAKPGEEPAQKIEARTQWDEYKRGAGR